MDGPVRIPSWWTMRITIQKTTNGTICAMQRTAKNSQNVRGRHKDRKYPGSLKGAYRIQGRWVAMIGFEGKQRYLGRFNTEIEAHEAYCREAKILHGEFHRSD